MMNIYNNRGNIPAHVVDLLFISLIAGASVDFHIVSVLIARLVLGLKVV